MGLGWPGYDSRVFNGQLTNGFNGGITAAPPWFDEKDKDEDEDTTTEDLTDAAGLEVNVPSTDIVVFTGVILGFAFLLCCCAWSVYFQVKRFFVNSKKYS